MTYIPQCPDHALPMKNQGRGWFCSKGVGFDAEKGKKIYCTRRFSDSEVAQMAQRATPQPPRANPNPSPVPPAMSPLSGKYHLAAAAITSASWIWGQVTPDFHPQVMETAKHIYREMEQMVKS